MSKRTIKISVIGNSVAIRVRPPEQYPENLNYTQLLDRKLNQQDTHTNFVVNSLAKGGETVNEMLVNLDNYIRLFPDVYILNIGVVDASTREIPKWFFNIINNKQEGRCRNFMKLLYNGIIKKHRRKLVLLFGKRTWIGKRKFRKAYTTLVSNLIKETNAKIITMAINPSNERIEKEVPGSKENYMVYNDIIKDISKEFGLEHLNFDDLVSKNHYPDGVHYSREGHELVSERILNILKKILK